MCPCTAPEVSVKQFERINYFNPITPNKSKVSYKYLGAIGPFCLTLCQRCLTAANRACKKRCEEGHCQMGVKTAITSAKHRNTRAVGLCVLAYI